MCNLCSGPNRLSGQSFRPETFTPAHRLIAYIREHAPSAEILIHQTWAYRDDFAGFAAEDFDPVKMHEGLTAAYEQLAAEYDLRLIPVGGAFHGARSTPQWSFRLDPSYDFENPPEGKLPDQSRILHVGYIWHTADGRRVLRLDHLHANSAGRYLGAAVWYEMLFGEPAPTSAAIPAGLTAETAADLRRIAREAVASRVGR